VSPVIARNPRRVESNSPSVRRDPIRTALGPKHLSSVANPALGSPLCLQGNTYLVQTQPGLEGVAWEEIAARFEADFPLRPKSSQTSTAPTEVRELGRRLVPGRAGMTIFTASHPEPLRELRTCEDIFAVVGYRFGLFSGPAALEDIAAVARHAPYIESALAVRTRLVPGARSGRRLRYRVVARMVGEHQYRRNDFARAVSRGIAERNDRSWRLVEDDADVEFWATLLLGELILAIRLSDERMRHRGYKVAHIPGSLRPSVAAALVRLSHPEPQDVVLDPFCGAGTVLIERAHAQRYALLIGCDYEPRALSAARDNIGPRYKPIELHPWDALAVPLPNHSVRKIITNLPWGVRHGSHEDNRRFYPRIISEFQRLLSPGGRIVMLTAETRLMSELIGRRLFHPERIVHASILGARAGVYVATAPH
jgi:tRNA (guanine6-N2)-methyltransferase